MSDTQTIFEHVLSLVGHKVSLSKRSDGKSLTGTIRNAMFDSLILENATGNHIIRFTDLNFLNPEPA